MKYRASPNFNERKDGDTVKYVLIHYTGMTSTPEALDRLCDPKSEVSAHYLVDEDGTVTQLVDETLRAWHAGESKWHSETDVNGNSIGIELSNSGHDFTYPDFARKQLDSLENLLAEIFKRYELPANALIAHSDVAPTRKQDPGEKFPWKDFAAKGYGVWPEETSVETETNIEAMLSSAGYDCADLKAAKEAFQRHYCVEELDTDETKLTLKRLNGLCTRPSGENLPLSKRFAKWCKRFRNFFINRALKINN